MRKASAYVIAAFLAGFLAQPLRADEAKKIMDEYVKAIGGSKAISHLQTLAIDGSILAAGDAVPGTYTFKAKAPNRLYTELRVRWQRP